MTGTFPILKNLGGHNTVEDLAIGIPAAVGALVAGPEILGAVGPALGFGTEAAGVAGAGAADAALTAGVPAAAFGDPTAAAIAGSGLTGGAVGAPGASAALGFGGTLADAGPFTGLPSDLLASDAATAGTGAGAIPFTDPLSMGAQVAAGAPGGFTGTGVSAADWSTAAAQPLLDFGGGGATAATPGAVPGAAAATDPAYLWGAGGVPFAGATGGVPPAGATGPSLMDSLGLTGIGNFAKNNAGMLGLLGLSAGAQLLNANKALPYSQQQLQAAEQAQGIAGQQAKFAKTTEQNLLSGTLPPGAEAAVAKGTQDAISTIKGRYASMGLTGSTMEADAIANAQQQATIQRFTIADQMAQLGTQAVSSATQALQLESNVYNGIMNAVLAQDQNLANAVSNFASSAALGTAIGSARAPAAVA
jgi:hypothetical protein